MRCYRFPGDFLLCFIDFYQGRPKADRKVAVKVDLTVALVIYR